MHESVVHMSLFQFGFERRKCPNASAETTCSVRRERPVKEEEEEEKEEFEEEGSKEDGEKALQQQREGKFQRAIHENNLPLP